MQLTTLIVLALQLMRPAIASTTRAPNPLTQPTMGPVCLQPPVCMARSPRVCGRLPNGLCRRFRNICELIAVNRRDVSADRRLTWTHTQERDCRLVRRVGAGNANWCQQDCPRRAVPCRRTPRAQEICVRSRNLRSCRVLANRCQLLNLNCFGRPRNNWLPAPRRLCGQLRAGDRPRACQLRLPSRRPDVTISPPVLPRPPTSELPPTTTTSQPAATSG
ncbi:hypothetical protein AWZ03_013355 [Drosophila navojoa]|uniref:Kazal-like domain-containing protein n=1 Tax=Drosophila navojoa TaxID=7232 RepID=A0A484AX81_DRONA|nr:uncharacterized protein LOC115564799 [Drosophila navojoa]TDG40221.1 hypothetical protein AWZ03_013355 [Drosophila navojoa]